MIKEAIMKLAKKENLTFEETEQVMNEIMGGEATGCPDEFLSDRTEYERGNH